MKRTPRRLAHPENATMREQNASYWADGTKVVCLSVEAMRLVELAMRPAPLRPAIYQVTRRSEQQAEGQMSKRIPE